ncbi:MAG: hypothetical protein WEB58_14200 [Planctomycetaceae bacterium]
MQPQNEKLFTEVQSAEVEAIYRRRREAGFNDPQTEKTGTPPTVGLAFSGGGIRSGSVCLGFLQALYRRHVLRHVDYLSTVSGGGYAGAFFSSLVLDDVKYPKIDWKPGIPSGKGTTLAILPNPAGQQPDVIRRLMHGGQRLNDPLSFVRSWFLGVILLNLFALSGLIVVAALFALFFRMLDLKGSMFWLRDFGVVSDVDRAFFWPLIAFLLWIGVTIGSRWWKWCLRLRNLLFAVFCTMLAMGFCTYLLTADLASPVAEKTSEMPDQWRQSLNNWTGQITTFLLVALGGALLPYLNPKRLLQSGTEPQKGGHGVVEGWIFAITSRALLYGVPLLAFAILTRENISGENETRENYYHLQSMHLDKFDAFWYRVWWEKRRDVSPGNDIWDKVESALHNDKEVQEKLNELKAESLPKNAFSKTTIGKIVDEYKAVRKLDETNSWENAIKASHIFPWMWASVRQANLRRNTTYDLQEKAAKKLNEVLANPDFADSLAPFSFPLNLVLRPEDTPYIDNDRLQTLTGELRRLPPVPNNQADSAGNSWWKALLNSMMGRPPSSAQANTDDARGKYLQREIRRINWEFLHAHYGPVVRSPDTVFALVVAGKDQQRRATVLYVAVAVFLMTGFLIDLNSVSLHGYYRQKLGELWINELSDYGYKIPLKSVNTTEKGAPYHLINGALNLMQRSGGHSQKATTRFTFSRFYCGSTPTGFARTEHYCPQQVNLADAIGISAAAINPTAVKNPLARVLLLILNFRLGQWLPNPKFNSPDSWWAVPLRLFFNWIRYWDPEDRVYCFVSDGGHDENTGVSALLERKCRIIIAVDATYDPDYEFADFLKLIRIAAEEHGAQIVGLDKDRRTLPITFETLKPAPTKESSRQPQSNEHEKSSKRGASLAESSFLVLGIKYISTPDESEKEYSERELDGYLLLVKPNLTKDAPTSLYHYRYANYDFPHDMTLDQFYDHERFASYVQLGEHIGNAMCKTHFSESSLSGDQCWLADSWNPTENANEKDAKSKRSTGRQDSTATDQEVIRLRDLGRTPFNKTNIDQIPQNASGVFVLYEDREIIYINDSVATRGSDLRKRLKDFQNGKEGSGLRQSTHFAYRLAEHSSKLAEQLRDEFRQKYGREPKYQTRR